MVYYKISRSSVVLFQGCIRIAEGHSGPHWVFVPADRMCVCAGHASCVCPQLYPLQLWSAGLDHSLTSQHCLSLSENYNSFFAFGGWERIFFLDVQF